MRYSVSKLLLSLLCLSFSLPSYATTKPASATISHKKSKHTRSKGHHTKTNRKRKKNYMVGPASFYSHKFDGRVMANGDEYDPDAFTAAHARLPLGTKLKVTNLDDDSDNGRVLYVEVTDRMSSRTHNIIDLSPAAAKYLNQTGRGLKVRLQVISDAEFESHDMNKLLANSAKENSSEDVKDKE